MTRDFHLGVILTVTTSRMVVPYFENNLDAVAELLNYMTGEQLYVAALPRAGHECRGPLLNQHPALADIEVPDFHESLDEVKAWLAVQIERFGETLPVAPLHPDDHTRIRPVEELRRINPGAVTPPGYS